MNETIRTITEKDLPAVKAVLDSSELFPSEMLDDMIADFFNNKNSTDFWFTAIKDGTPISLGYCAPEQMTEGTFNLYAIAVDKQHQGTGIGSEMMGYIENHLRENDARILLVETSGTADFELSRKFYQKIGYKQQAIIPKFYAKGDDKVVFWKKLIEK
ncbi:MAG: N-acetyltransferase family protein [Crocinitomicaceae bacterium]